MSKYRKAIAAFLAPLLTLPLVGMVSGDIDVDVATVAGVGLAAVTGLVTYYFPNAADGV